MKNRYEMCVFAVVLAACDNGPPPAKNTINSTSDMLRACEGTPGLAWLQCTSDFEAREKRGVK